MDILGKIKNGLANVGRFFRKYFRWMRYLNPFHYLSRLDRYIIKQFIGTYIFSILLIISIAIVFDCSENISKFTEHNATWRAIIFDYYVNFIPYYANLFSPLFVFIAVIFFTSKLAGNSEIIAMSSAGVSFRRLMRPYFISCVLISIVSYILAAYVIPTGTITRLEFESLYKNNKREHVQENFQLQVEPGTIAFMQHFDDRTKQGNGFSLDKFEGKKLIDHLTASVIQYDTISDEKFHWTIRNWERRKLVGLKEKVTSGIQDSLVMQIEPTDIVYSKGLQETFTSPELRDYISKQQSRGSGNVVHYEVEYHKRIASSFAAFILTLIGASLSARKRKGGMGLYLGIGLALSCAFILLQTISSTFAINAGLHPMLAAWIPNILFAFVAYFCYRKAPN